MEWKARNLYSKNGGIVRRKVLLTGATGFVGMQVLKALQADSADITLVVRSGWRNIIKNQEGVTAFFETEDIFLESPERWATMCHGIDIIIHLAWYAEPGKYLLSDKNIDCLTGSLNLAKGAIIAGVRRFIGVGTCFEYDLTSCMLSTDTLLNPTTPYAAAKAATYLTLSQWLPQKGIEFAWCRLFYLYGEGEDDRRLAPYIRSKLEGNQLAELTSGDQIRDFLDVSKAGHMIVKVAFDSVQGALNICSGVPITVRQFAEEIADEYGKREFLKFGIRPDNLIDPPCVVGVR